MQLSLKLPEQVQGMRSADVLKILVQRGDKVQRGKTLVEVRIDLSGGVAQDCPPVFFFRLVAREEATVDQVHVQSQQHVAVGEEIMRLSVPEGEGLRDLRFSAFQFTPDPFAR